MSEGADQAASTAAPVTGGEPVLRAEGVTAGYGGPPIVEDVSIAVPAGKITAVVGPNGAGKSTLLKALSGVVRTSRGEVYVRGTRTTNMRPEKLVKRGLGYVPQVSNIFPDLTVRENMEMGGYLRRHGVGRRIDELCELFPDLGRSLRRRAGLLSGGQRTMLAIRARAQPIGRTCTAAAGGRERRAALCRPDELTTAGRAENRSRIVHPGTERLASDKGVPQ